MSAPSAEGPSRSLRFWYASFINETAADETGSSPLRRYSTPSTRRRRRRHHHTGRTSRGRGNARCVGDPVLPVPHCQQGPRQPISFNALYVAPGGRTLRSLDDYLQPAHASRIDRLRSAVAMLLAAAGYPEADKAAAAAAAVDTERRLGGRRLRRPRRGGRHRCRVYRRCLGRRRSRADWRLGGGGAASTSHFSDKNAHFPQTPSLFLHMTFQSFGYVMNRATAFRVCPPPVY